MSREVEDYISRLKRASIRGGDYEGSNEAAQFAEFYEEKRTDLPANMKKLRAQLIIQAGQELANLMSIKAFPRKIGQQLAAYVSALVHLHGSRVYGSLFILLTSDVF